MRIRNLLFLSIQTTVTVSCYLSPLFVEAVHCIAGLVQFVYIYAELQSERCPVCSFISWSLKSWRYGSVVAQLLFQKVHLSPFYLLSQPLCTFVVIFATAYFSHRLLPIAWYARAIIRESLAQAFGAMVLLGLILERLGQLQLLLLLTNQPISLIPPLAWYMH